MFHRLHLSSEYAEPDRPAICKKVSFEFHGGKMEIVSIPGRALPFYFQLKLKRERITSMVFADKNYSP
jgi:hypothetical protein